MMAVSRTLLTAVLGTTVLFPVAAAAQTREDCDLLIAEIDRRQGEQLPVTREQVAVFIEQSDFAQCRTFIQQVQAQQPGQEGQPAQEGQEGSNIVVQQPAPVITVDPATPQVSVQQTPPNVTVRQPQPEIIVRQPAPVVTIDIPQPEIIVRMPQPEVAVQQTPPQVQVVQPEPQVIVEQPEQPQVQVQEGEQPTVALTGAEGQANVQVEQTGEAQVTYERAEPQVTINQAEGQPQITVEQMEAGQPAAGEQAAAGQQPAQLRDSEDANATPEAQEGQQPAAGQQAAVTQEQPAATQAGQMHRVAIREIEGMDVVNARGEQLGDVEGVVRSAVDNKAYVIIDHGGFLGLGEKRIALSMEGLMVQNDRIVVPGLTDEEIEALPEFEITDQFTELGADEFAEFRMM
jgi:sporulation protein YlmC with PRC-barrel domain